MTHFTVLVIGEDVERKLAPYEEELGKDPKWDWYSIGGRWLGMLKLKEGKVGGVGRAGVFGNAPVSEGGVDQAKYGDIDWEAMGKPSGRELESYNGLWNWVEGKITDEEARDKHIFTLYKKEYYLNRWGSREEYIRRQGLFGTYAVVTEDGLWHSPGDMGWWGSSSETDDQQRDWDNNYWDRFLKDLSPDTLITVVDCHI